MRPIEIIFKGYNEEYKARFYKDNYVDNGNLYIGIMTWNKKLETWEFWGDLTVNLGTILTDDKKAFLDTNNCSHELIGILMDKGYIKDAGIARKHGFCTYPLVEFSEEFLNRIE